MAPPPRFRVGEYIATARQETRLPAPQVRRNARRDRQDAGEAVWSLPGASKSGPVPGDFLDDQRAAALDRRHAAQAQIGIIGRVAAEEAAELA